MDSLYHPKLDKVFNTLDSHQLTQNIHAAYGKRTCLTVLVDAISVHDIITFHPKERQWRRNDTIINTLDSFPFTSGAIIRWVHEKKMESECSCTESYRNDFYEKVEKLVEAHLLTMIPFAEETRKENLQRELDLLKEERTRAREHVDEESQVIVDLELNGWEDEKNTKSGACEKYKNACTQLRSYHQTLTQAPSSRLSALFSSSGTADCEAKRQQAIESLRGLDLLTNDLKTIQQVRAVLVILDQQVANMDIEIEELATRINTRKVENQRVWGTRVLAAHQAVLALDDRIIALERQLTGTA